MNLLGSLSQTGAQTAGGAVTLTTDAMSLTKAINASGATVTVAPETLNRTITVGGTSDPGNDLFLSTASLNQIKAATLVIGNGSSDGGALTVNAALTTSAGGALQNLTNLSLAPGAGTIAISNAVTLASTGVLTLDTDATVTQSAALTVTGAGSGLLLLGTGGTFTLTGATNSITTVAANTGSGSGSISLTNGATALSIGTVGGSNGITTGTLTLTDTGTVTQGQPIAATSVALLGSGATYTLTNGSNSIGTLAASVGSGTVSVTDSAALSLGTVGSTNGVTAATLTLSDAGTVTQSQAIDVTSLALLGSGATLYAEQRFEQHRHAGGERRERYGQRDGFGGTVARHGRRHQRRDGIDAHFER